MKVSELTGAPLDYWVARAEGMSPYVEGRLSADNKYCRVYAGDCGENGYSPSTNWAQGGPIIERERIELITHWEHGWEAGINCLGADGIGAGFGGMGYRGDTPLIAAMRAHVAWKFGDTIEDS